MKKIVSFLLLFVILACLCGCRETSSMPFNGAIAFHKVSLTVPDRFVRDSTKSNENLWIFEHGMYKEYIILSRKDAVGDELEVLQSYADYMTENGGQSSVTVFQAHNAVLSSYYVENVYCQEILFCFDNSYYAVALRGGTEEGFREITDTLVLLP